MNNFELSNKISAVDDLLKNKINKTENVKEMIDLEATKTALKLDDTAEKIVLEKKEELINEAEAKRLVAEQERILQEKNKEIVEKERQCAEYDKLIQLKEKEVEALNKDIDKANAYFSQNKEILKYVGIKNKKSLSVMKFWIYPASFIFAIVQILMLPLTICGVLLENILSIVGSVCGEIKNNALKIILSIVVVAIVIAVVVLAYFYGGRLIASLWYWESGLCWRLCYTKVFTSWKDDKYKY